METKPGDLEGLAQSTTKAIEKDGVDTNLKHNPSSTYVKEEAPDPDEDDLDDLDDMLDEFSPSKPSASTTAPKESKSQIPDPEDGLSDEEFAKKVKEGMSELLGELETSPEMAAQFEAMMKELGAASLVGEGDDGEGSISTAKETPTTTKTKEKTPAPATGSTAPEESFQETIKKTMERMRASGDSATAAAATSSTGTEDLMETMLKAMQEGGLGGEGNEEDFSKMLLGMMEQLTNKEILYEPMKELDEKFPGWMKENEGKVGEQDWKRYVEQRGYVREIVERFERKGYSDENAADREYIVERMQKMQAAGSPPPDLVGNMQAAQEAFGNPEELLEDGKLEEQCSQQ